MKRLLIISGSVIGIIAILAGELPGQLLLFVLSGQLPFTSIVLPPTFMLLFWISIIPLSVFAARHSGRMFWRALEVLGTVHQRHINIRYRQLYHLSQTEQMFAIVALYVVSHATETPVESPKSYFRRRFVPLPT